MRWFLLIFFLQFVVGCAADRQTELLEARLREQQDYAAQLASQLEHARADLSVARQESSTLRQQLLAKGKQPLEPEQADVLYRMTKLKIDPLQSSIIPAGASNRPVINLVVTPVDQFNEPLKLPGQVAIELFTQTSGNSPVEKYQFSAAEVRKKWNSGWVSSGFVFQLPWPEKVPFEHLTGEQIEVKSVFTTADGRTFSASRKLKIKKSLNSSAESSNGVKQAGFSEKEAKPARIDTSDRRTIDEFPVLR